MTDDDPGEEIVRATRRMARSRETDPVGFLAMVLERIWLESEPDDVEFLWRHQHEGTPWWTENALLAFDAVLAAPPEDLPTWLDEHAARDAEDRAAGLAWLRAQRDLARSWSG